nr:YjgN family protein [uncultured Sphingomonas sp.]
MQLGDMMDQYVRTSADPDKAVVFTGTWREYLPIAASNALLTIVTLGIYRFWAAARQRRYLWSRTELIGDPLEWTGTGKEMFIGFLMVMAVMMPFFLFFQFLLPALAARGLGIAAGMVVILFYIAILYLGGFAQFRALRYRLSRSWWRGIRGGSDEPGWNYGGEYLGRTIIAGMTWGIAWPWQAVHLWNSRWNNMSFGQQSFSTDLNADGLKARWFAIYLAPIAVLVLIGIIFAAVGFGTGQFKNEAAEATLGTIFLALFLLVYLIVPLAMLNWYAAFYRKAADELRLGDLAFGFDATTWQWLKLWLGNIALAIVTLGLGLTYWGYRNWSFIIRHLHVYGQVDVSMMQQSTTHAPTEAEGFADAFDIGAI